MFCITAGLVQMDSYMGIARLVLLVTVHLVLCFLPCLQARDPRHHGRYGPEGLVCCFLTLSLALCSSCCLRPQMPVIMAGMDHRTVWRITGAVLGQGFLHARCCATSGVLVQTVLYTVWRFRSCSSSRSSISCCGTEAYSHGLAVQQTIEFPQLLWYMLSTSLLCRLCSFPGGLQFLDTLTTCPLLLTTGAWSWTVSNCRGFRSCSSLMVFDISVVADADSYGPDCSDDH